MDRDGSRDSLFPFQTEGFESLLPVLELHDDFDGDISDIICAVSSVVLFLIY